MSGFFHSLGQMLGRMVRALFTWAIAVGGLATAGFSVAARHLPTASEWVLIGMLTLAAGAVGVLGTLVWELSHLGQISRAVRHHQDAQPTYHQP
ncbi:MAG: hypothetical protein H0X24_07790 [Ktedonobacterales bacterium]|nr:hypothetical protein [Ktedonobacterales bacterium]